MASSAPKKDCKFFFEDLMQQSTFTSDTVYKKQKKKLHAFGRTFFSIAETKDGILYEWLQMRESSVGEANNFMFCLEYQGFQSTHVFFGKVSSVHETQESIISSGNCSSIGFETFKNQFVNMKRNGNLQLFRKAR